jgi:hypothetical protein
MIERRNFYRILHAQPDAPMAIIKENYQLLMQRLMANPGLSNSNWSIELLNMAYDTLRDSRKRAAYDHELLKAYHIEALSQGAFNLHTHTETKKHKDNHNSARNQRNYYRILQVQSDAPFDVIAVSYQMLKKSSSEDIALLDEAYRVLSDPLMRQQYDVILAASNSCARTEQATQTNNDVISLPDVKRMAQSAVEPYRTVIVHYCSFCKTPHRLQGDSYRSENCLECGSPLLSTLYDNIRLPRRTLKRIDIRGEFLFYLCWPSQPYEGLFQDLSPQGLRFLTEEAVYLHDIIKIDAPNLQAIAEVTHKVNEKKKTSVGVRFITVRFDQQQGNFVTTEV